MRRVSLSAAANIAAALASTTALATSALASAFRECGYDVTGSVETRRRVG